MCAARVATERERSNSHQLSLPHKSMQMRKARIMSNKRSSVHGVGINDADYPVYITKNKAVNGKNTIISKWECHFYSTWRNLIMRSYHKPYQEKNKNYIGVTICEEWLTFSNFKRWMEAQDYEGKHLDKDLISGSHYSPETCIFIDPKVNYFIRDSRKPEGLSGACFDKARNKWISSCSSAFGKVVNLGRFNTELEAHLAWKAEKLKQAKILAATLTDARVAELLVKRYE